MATRPVTISIEMESTNPVLREAIALEEENTGPFEARYEAIMDRFTEAEYRRATERR